MSNSNFAIGTRITHPKYGEGIIVGNDDEITYDIYFRAIEEEKEIARSFDGLVVVTLVEEDPDKVSLDEVKTILADIVEPLMAVQYTAELGERWEGGKLVIVPGKEGMQSKEIPLETFWHKIVMIRDRLRVMEQKINSSNLTDAEKVDIQQYITRIYGSLTTFNVLFDNKEEQFKGTGSS